MGIKTKHDGGKGIVGHKENPDGSSSKGNLAFTKGDDIYVNTRDGINPELSDANNLKNTLEHEKSHKEKGHGFKENTPNSLEHADVYLEQISSTTFAKSTEKFQYNTLEVMAGMLESASEESTNNGDEVIGGVVNQANSSLQKNNVGFRMNVPAHYSGPINVTVTRAKKN